MNELVNSFPISFLLRSMFAGVFFIISYCVATWKEPYQFIHSGNILSVALPVALVAGVTVYALHRSFAFALLEYYVFNSDSGMELRRKWPLLRATTARDIARRCDQKAKHVSQQCCERAKYMENWANYIHLQYTSSWCLVAGCCTGMIVHHGIVYHGIAWLSIAAFILFLGAFISNWRSYSLDDFWTKLPFTRK